MKWATDEYITIISTFNDRHQAADQEHREEIVKEVKLAIRAAAKAKGVDVPAEITKVTPIWVAFNPLICVF